MTYAETLLGKRIELIEMRDDPAPLPEGSRGVVTRASTHDFGTGPFTQVAVEWDNGRTLMLVVPPDRFRIIEEGA
jgi:hypothetical protein